MSTPLHDRDALVSLADGPPGAVRDWANTQLALCWPDHLVHLPSDPFGAEVAIAAGARGAVEAALSSPVVDAIGAWGLLPPDGSAWLDRLRARVDAGDARPARVVADLGGLDPALLAAVSRADDPAARTVLPALVVRYAAHTGADLAVVAREVVAELDADGITATLAGLGVPSIDASRLAPADAIRCGRELAGLDVEPLVDAPVARGSERRRACAWVHRLLDGRRDPASAVVRALADDDDVDLATVCAAAGWLSGRRAVDDARDDAVVDVIDRAAGEDRLRLSAARRRVHDDHAPELSLALADPRLRSVPARALAVPLLRGAHGGILADTLLDRVLEVGFVAVALAVNVVPEQIVAWLAEPRTRRFGWTFGRTCATYEVLAALLELEPPTDPADRAAWARALAELADPAAYAVLEQVGDPAALRRAAILLGRA